ncbi:50S ribosomal protein L13 [Halanaerobium saccharolyticum]|uniref:Large ribosomal subunit protein uL13 n=1 Tax=Halanaerobium saccharolyticum TaxID=43595 RepID=A0A2T5RMD3_9FIRM|nr:50S ribosomal protein L13 [Halanaerobium saccharolyticum]PTW00512.1 LSU ribosomal protein L13P [Halanaerobium saccharolyticum]PUU87137.1 MAG: large subunit ribosomal protein L13 [Halanaerobium sp.]TDQ06036.1 LSU ribosomal protein L13P [Halanaerobium saccharolyticum]
MSTYMAKNETVERDWYVVDAADKTLGRLASEIAQYIRGKHKPTFTPHVDMGDYVIVVNAEKVKLSGKKWDDKKHYSHTNHPGGIKEVTYKELRDKDPEFIIEKAVKGMLPHNKLGRKMFKKLKVYSGPNHPHQAQQPEKLEL